MHSAFVHIISHSHSGSNYCGVIVISVSTKTNFLMLHWRPATATTSKSNGSRSHFEEHHFLHIFWRIVPRAKYVYAILHITTWPFALVSCGTNSPCGSAVRIKNIIDHLVGPLVLCQCTHCMCYMYACLIFARC